MSARYTRRTFLAATGSALIGVPALPKCSLTAESAVPLPCDPSAWRKHGNVLTDAPARSIQNFTCPAEPLGDGRWRIWYSISHRGVRDTVAVAEGRLRLDPIAPRSAPQHDPMTHYVAHLSEGDPADTPFSIGNLPGGWRPVQIVHVPLSGGRHRIYFWAHGPKVVRYLAAESEDGRRYRVLDPHRPCLYHPNDRAVSGATAAEAGLKRLAKKESERPAGEPAAPARIVSNDATNVYQLPDGTFEMYSVALVEVDKDDPRYIAHDNAAGWVRVIDRYTSKDGLDWTDRRRVLVPDEQDPADQQFYYLAVTHTPKGRVGMLGHYRVEAQTMDLEWCFSEDGIQWRRPLRRAWITRGMPGEADSYGIYAGHNLVYQDSKWHLFYTGGNAAHNYKHAYGEPRQVIAWASCDSIWE